MNRALKNKSLCFEVVVKAMWAAMMMYVDILQLEIFIFEPFMAFDHTHYKMVMQS